MNLPVILILTVLTASSLFYFILTFISDSRLRTMSRLDDIKEIQTVTAEEDEYRKPFAERILKPFYQSFWNTIKKATPASIMKRYETLIIQAGRQGKTTAVRLIGQQLLLAILLSGTAYVLLPKSNDKRNLIILVACAMALVLPYFSLARAAGKRLALINQNLPDMLDLLYVSVEAGLGFDMAMKRTADKMKGPLADEFLHAITEMSRGRTHEDALRGVVARTQSPDLSTLITSIIQAEQLGSNIARTLQVQSVVMRQKRKQRAEEQAAKLSTKMLFPIVFFIFPTILLVIMGPMIMSLIDSLGGVF